MSMDNLDNTDARFKLNRLYTDQYLGHGKNDPPMTTRMALVEETLDRVTKNLNKATWLAVIAILGLIGDVIKSFILK